MDDIQYYDQPAAQSGGKSRRILFIVIILILLMGAVLLGIKLLNGKSHSLVSKTTPTPTEYIFPTDTPMASGAATPSVTPSLDKSSLTVIVENGSGTPGAAAKMTSTLTNLGYKVSSTTNADSFTYQGVTIKVLPTKEKYLSVLKKDLGDTFTITSATANLTSSAGADAVIIVGK